MKKNYLMVGEKRLVGKELLFSPGRGGGNDGYYFKDEEAFYKGGSCCYVSEHSMDDVAPLIRRAGEDGWYSFEDCGGYYFEDFLAIAKGVILELGYTIDGFEGQERAMAVAQLIFDGVDWQSPEVFAQELDEDILEEE